MIFAEHNLDERFATPGCEKRPDVVGMQLDRALETLGDMRVEQAVPPRGVPEREGVWRVVRADIEGASLTAAFFPVLKREGEEA